MNFLIRKVPLHVAHWLALSAEIISAEQARQMGLVHKVFTSTQLEHKTVELIESLLIRNSFQAMMQTKQLFQELLDLPLSRGLDLACEVNARNRWLLF